MKTNSKMYLAFVVIFSFLIGCSFMSLICIEYTTSLLISLIIDVIILFCNLVWFKRSLK